MSWWHYLLLVNFYLVLFFGFYVLLLRRETFFQLNRVYLVSAALLSFFIPLIQSNWVKNLFITQKVQHTIYNSPVIHSRVITLTYPIISAQSSLTIGDVLNGIYISVTLFLLLRLLWQLVILRKAIDKPEPSAAYSFFKKISLGNDLANPDVITAHEQVHAGQWHSVDVMIIETVMIINWFNPVVYLYRFAIKYIHEFIADKQVIQSGTDKADYALLLLNQTFNVPAHGLVTPFYNHTLLKRRLVMLQKNRSHRIALVKYGLSVPLFILMMILSSATINNSKAVNAINQKAQNLFSTAADEAVTLITDHAEIPGNTDNIVDEYVENYNRAQKELRINIAANTNEMVTSLQRTPKFPGSLSNFLNQNIKYPAAMRQANVQGIVNVAFVVEADGSISDIKATSSPGYGSGEEAERVMALSPKWTPAYQNGKPVRVMYTIPIKFSSGNVENVPPVADAADKNKVFIVTENLPVFPGGQSKFNEFLRNNIKYPELMQKANVGGKVYVEFIVETDGSLSNIAAIRNSEYPGYGSGEEAERVVALSPKWTPGYNNGKPVRSSLTIPISFTLSGAKISTQNLTADSLRRNSNPRITN